MIAILLIVVLLPLFGGGWGYGRRRRTREATRFPVIRFSAFSILAAPNWHGSSAVEVVLVLDDELQPVDDHRAAWRWSRRLPSSLREALAGQTLQELVEDLA